MEIDIELYKTFYYVAKYGKICYNEHIIQTDLIFES